MGPDQAQPLTPRLLDALYTEAMLLADEARSYFEDRGRIDRAGLDPLTRVGFSCESLKITTRLMHVVAWLLTRRADEAGEFATPGRRKPRRLGTATESDPVLVAKLPAEARALVESSRDLYARVQRFAGVAVGAPAPSPARALINRLERSL